MLEKAPLFNFENKLFEIIRVLKEESAFSEILNEYLYWDKLKYKQLKYPNELIWNAIKLEKKISSKNLEFGKYKFTYLITDYIQKALHHFDLNIGGNLGSNITIPDTKKNKFLINSIMEEAISSSQMEGANTTRKRAKEMIRNELKPKNKSDQMILNNYYTMQHIVQNKDQDLNFESLFYIHELISKNTLDNPAEEGVLRSSDDIYIVNNTNSEIVHTPPNHTELNKLLLDLFEFFNQDQDNFVHPILKGIIVHFMIGFIHPFTDGNGRTARALFYWYMLKNGYWLTEYLSISRIIKDTKVQYEKAYLYTEIDENDLGYFITYHIKTMEKAFEALKEYINKKQSEGKQTAKFIKIPNVNERMAQILKILNDDSDRIFSSKEIEHRFGVSNFTARADLNSLVEMGFLEIIKVNKRKQNFVKSKNFEKLIENE